LRRTAVVADGELGDDEVISCCDPFDLVSHIGGVLAAPFCEVVDA
jgi:hypothetical protein